MVLVASDVMLLRAGGFNLAVFCSLVFCERSTLLAGDARLPLPFRGVEGVSPTGALLGPTESCIKEKPAQVVSVHLYQNLSELFVKYLLTATNYRNSVKLRDIYL